MATAWIEQHTARDGSIRHRLRGKLAGNVLSLGVYTDEAVALDRRAAWLKTHAGDDAAHTLASWGERWLCLRETDGQHRSAREDRLRWRKHVGSDPIAAIALERLASKHVRAWSDRLVRREPEHVHQDGDREVRRTIGTRLSSQTVRHVWRLLSMCLRDAVEREMIDASPIASLKCPRVIDEPKNRDAYMETAEIARLAALPVSRKMRRAADGSEPNAITPMQRSACLVAIYTGLRAGELWGLRWCDVRLDGESPDLDVRRSRSGPTKSRRARRVPLLAPAVAALREWRELAPGVGEALVWPGDCGAPYGEGYDAGWERIRTMIGVTVRWHDLRHTCGSHLVMGTWTARPLELIDVRDWLGHQSIRTTERYAHLRPGRLHDLARTPPQPQQAAEVAPVVNLKSRRERSGKR